MQIDGNAPVTARGKIAVAASRDVIWDLLTTMDRWPDWNPDVQTATQPDLGWTGTSMGMHAVHVWRLETDGQQTIARTEESWSGPLPRLLPGRMRKSLRKTLDSWLSHLETEAEVRSRQ